AEGVVEGQHLAAGRTHERRDLATRPRDPAFGVPSARETRAGAPCGERARVPERGDEEAPAHAQELGDELSELRLARDVMKQPAAQDEIEASIEERQGSRVRSDE